MRLRGRRFPGPKATEILTAPTGSRTQLSVTNLMVYFVMTALAKTHQIASVMGAALWNGNLVVYLINRDKDALLEAPLTEGMRLNIAVTNPFPCSAVLFMHR